MNKGEHLETTYDFSKNPNQAKFIAEALRAFVRKSPYRYFFFGGAIRGGKTTACLALCIMYALKFKGCRIHIIRKSESILLSTTVVSLKQMLSERHVSAFTRKGILFKNGSYISFFPESYNNDPELNHFKGLETNLIFLEQLEEIAYETFQMAMQRVGTYKNKFDPPGIILSTFNPTFSWLREKIYQPYVEGKLQPPYYYQTVLPTDNPFLPQELFQQWETLDPISYRRYILGDWDSSDMTGLFAYSFDKTKHVGEVHFDPYLPIWLSFDFNVNPMTCIMCQFPKDKSHFYVLREFYKENTGISEFCEYIKKELPPGHPIYVTGDPAGKNRSALARSNTNYYHEIRQVLRVKNEHIQVMRVHPTHENSWVVFNKFLHSFNDFKIHPSCRRLIDDLLNIRMMEDGSIEKDKRITARGPTIGHLLDTLRYIIHLHFWSNIVRS
jgi:PBSX family phage terminase large subunit